MLFYHWRNEETELGVNVDVQAKYHQHIEEILEVKRLFAPEENEEELHRAFEEIQRQANEEEEENGRRAPGEEGEEDEANEYDVLRPRRPSQNRADILVQMGAEPPHDRTVQRVQRRAGDYQELRRRMSLVNANQRQLIFECLRRAKLDTPFHFFISGGAGVGKSFFIDTLNLALDIYYHGREGADGSTIKVLLCAPTGKAAFNIRGLTLHAAFALPFEQRAGEMRELGADVANTIAAEFRDLKLIIIDEISMVGRKKLYKIDQRMKQICHSQEPFGGKSVVVVGDFNQLVPVGDP